jgi:heme-degrading monooxygenase HmoA
LKPALRCLLVLGYNGRMTTTVGMHYDVIAGKEQEFENGFRSVIDHLKSVAGHVESHLYVDVDSPGSYLILSQWQNQEAFTAFLRSAEFAKVTAWGRAEILRSRPRHKVYADQS